MKRKVAIFAFAFLVSGCGAGSPAAKSSSAEPAAVQEGSESSAGIDSGDSLAGVEKPDVFGTWENSSCGERRYLRRITLLEGGGFDAVDEVAPCPPNAKCIWSGIIAWKGNWSLNGNEISIEVEPVEGGRSPEQIPGGYVVLNDDPISIGERAGEIICPYKKAQ